MQLGHSVHRLAPNDCEIRHANRAFPLFSNKGHASDLLFVIRKLPPHIVKKASIDLKDYFQVPRQQLGKRAAKAIAPKLPEGVYGLCSRTSVASASPTPHSN